MNFKTLILLSLILLGGICTGCDTEKQLLATRGGVLYCHERFIQQPNFQFVIW